MIKNPYPGKFIVFEGLDGCGKSTQAKLLQDFLIRSKKKCHLTKEPTSRLIGGLIKSQLLGDWKSSPECLQLLFAADRAYHLEKEVVPLLKKGVWVISDRYFFSSLAYGNLKIKDLDWLVKINQRFLLPDLTFFLKVSPKICLQRIKKSRFELTLFEKERMLERVWQNYENVAEIFGNVYIVDGERSAQEVAKEVKEIVNEKLKI